MQVEKASVDCRRMSLNECPACSRKIYESLVYGSAINEFHGDSQE